MKAQFNQIQQISGMLNAARVLLLVEHSWREHSDRTAYAGAPDDCLNAGIQLIGLIVPLLSDLHAAVVQVVLQVAPERREELDRTFDELWSGARELARAYETVALNGQGAFMESLATSRRLLERLRLASD
ncbi:hypothetical protein JI745_18120 [Piscinibacter sp. HJYY11]|nr:hypothetical protein [Piscinibacter sp. HJYY11]